MDLLFYREKKKNISFFFSSSIQLQASQPRMTSPQQCCDLQSSLVFFFLLQFGADLNAHDSQ